jgi:hypothetical protein
VCGIEGRRSIADREEILSAGGIAFRRRGWRVADRNLGEDANSERERC